MTDRRFPIGKFNRAEAISNEQLPSLFQKIRILPQKVEEAMTTLSPEDLALPYRQGGWTLKQVIHHLADSHMNAFIRFKLALTEDTPTIKPYDQDKWVMLPDSRTADPEMSLSLLKGLHERWFYLLQNMTPADFDKKFQHPENGIMDLRTTLALYAWHGEHHTAHLQLPKESSIG